MFPFFLRFFTQSKFDETMFADDDRKDAHDDDDEYNRFDKTMTMNQRYSKNGGSHGHVTSGGHAEDEVFEWEEGRFIATPFITVIYPLFSLLYPLFSLLYPLFSLPTPFITVLYPLFCLLSSAFYLLPSIFYLLSSLFSLTTPLSQ